MERDKIRPPRLAIGIAAALLAVATAAQAGPPLICHAIDIGQARSLPWADAGALSGNGCYNLHNLVPDTLAILNPSTPVLVRMETLRRATLYAGKDPTLAKELLMRLYQRATSVGASGRPDALAWFDVGYLAECYKQWNEAVREGLGRGKYKEVPVVAGLDGYVWVRKAMSLRGQDPEMEFAAALITLKSRSNDHQKQVQRAMAGAKQDPLLARNLAAQIMAR